MAGPRWRVIVDNDFAGDPDGLASLAHVLLTDDVRIELITCTPVDPGLAHLAGLDPSATATLAAEAARALLDVISDTAPPVVAGADTFASRAEPSAAARAIVGTAAVDSDVPLAILCGGPLTNIAAAIALDPGICARAILVWIGGSIHDAPEYNRDTDAEAAASVLASSMPIVQIPLETYERLRVSIAEVKADLAGASSVGRWVAERLLDLPPFVTLHGVLTLGDSGLAAVVALDPTFHPADPATDAARRVVTDIDTRLVWGDFLAKLRLRHPETDSA